MTKTSKWSFLGLCVVLIFGSYAMAQVRDGSEGRRCSNLNRTLFGNYGTQIEGTILGPNWTLRTITLTHFDGARNVTSLDHVVVNGEKPPEEWRPGTGTYEVYADCRGKWTVDTPPGFPELVVYFVVVKGGKEIHGVVDGSAITVVAYKVD